MNKIRDRVQSAYDILQQLPERVYEQDLRLVQVKMQLAIVLEIFNDGEADCS